MSRYEIIFYETPGGEQPAKEFLLSLEPKTLRTVEKTGINQADISKLERGNANPSLLTLQRLAEEMGMRLSLKFEAL